MSYPELMEQRRHGSPGFPVQYYFVDSSHPRYAMTLHWHKEFEILRVLSGSFDAYIDNDFYHVSQGEALLINCGSLHRGEPCGCVYECLVFDAAMLMKSGIESLLRSIHPVISRTVSIQPFCTAEDEYIMKSINALFDEITEKKEFYELRMFSHFFALFAGLYSGGRVIGPEEEKKDGMQLRCMMKMLNWIDEHYTEAISLDDLSEISGLNEKYLCRFFRKYTNQTPLDYINHRRIEAACVALTQEGKSVTEAAMENGFNDLSYFSKLFRRIKGFSPREYAVGRRQ